MNSGETTSSRSPATPIANRICAGAVVVFAVWTVCTHSVVALGGNLHHLLLVFAVAASCAVVAARRLARIPPDAPLEGLGTEEKPRPAWLRVLQLVGLAIGIGLAVTAVDGPAGVTRLWWIGILTLGCAALFFLLLEGPKVSDPVRGRIPEFVLWGIACLCAVVAVVVHRPDIDDSFYVNVAVAAADFPHVPLLSRDTMLGVADLPLHMPAHRIHTYELWNGALAYITGIPAILMFHWVSAAFVGGLLALAHARLFRLLTPRLWPWAVAALVVVLLGVGETHRWFGNFSLVRMWQGKGAYLFVFMPLVYAYAIAFALRPSARRWILLWAAQTAAVGCSSSAVWAAPVGAWVAMCCILRPTGAGLRTFALGALSSAYVLGVGLALKGDVQPLLTPMIERFVVGAQLATSLRYTLGSERLWHVGIATILTAWAFCPRGLAQRFALGTVFAVLLILLNPYLDFFIRTQVTGPSYWRSMWALPVPALMALILISPLRLAGDGFGRRAAASGAFAALCIAFLVAVPRFSALSSRNAGAGAVGIRLGVPSVKAPPETYRVAAALNESVPPGSPVIAPPNVGVWVTTFHDHAYPMQSRRLYLERHRANLGDVEVNVREFLTQYVGGSSDFKRPHRNFHLGLYSYGIKGVALRDSELAPGSRRILEANGFSRTFLEGEYEVWARP